MSSQNNRDKIPDCTTIQGKTSFSCRNKKKELNRKSTGSHQNRAALRKKIYDTY